MLNSTLSKMENKPNIVINEQVLELKPTGNKYLTEIDISGIASEGVENRYFMLEPAEENYGKHLIRVYTMGGHSFYIPTEDIELFLHCNWCISRKKLKTYFGKTPVFIDLDDKHNIKDIKSARLLLYNKLSKKKYNSKDSDYYKELFEKARLEMIASM